MAELPLHNWYSEIPPVTRFYATAVVAVTFLCVIIILIEAIGLFRKREYWRLLTNFLYFGSFGIDFIFYLFFLIRYCRMLEEGSFRGRNADFLWMLILGMICLLLIAPLVQILFLGSSLVFMIVYVWSRRNPDIPMNFLGLFNFTAPFMPWVLLGFSLLINGQFPLNDILGIILGHAYFFFEDVYPVSSGTGRRYLRAPTFLKRLWEPATAEEQAELPHRD